MFLKKSMMSGLEEAVEEGLTKLLGGWRSGEVEGLEGRLYRWSTGGAGGSSTMTALSGTVMDLLLGGGEAARGRLEQEVDALAGHVRQVPAASLSSCSSELPRCSTTQQS